eukprot:s953_g22.t1
MVLLRSWRMAPLFLGAAITMDALVDVCNIATTDMAFAAILANGIVVTWGGYAANSDTAHDRPKEVKMVRGAAYAFAALLSDGSVASWGHQSLGGDSSQVQAQLRDVQHLFSTESAFAAVLADRSVVTWGMDTKAVTARLRGSS